MQHHGHRGTLSDESATCPSNNYPDDDNLLDVDDDDYPRPESGGSCAGSITGASHRYHGGVRRRPGSPSGPPYHDGAGFCSAAIRDPTATASEAV